MCSVNICCHIFVNLDQIFNLNWILCCYHSMETIEQFHVNWYERSRRHFKKQVKMDGYHCKVVLFGSALEKNSVGGWLNLKVPSWTLTFTLTLWMLGNFLKIDYIVVCFLKPLNSACFLLGMMDWVANRLDLRPAAELLGDWPGSNLFA